MDRQVHAKAEAEWQRALDLEKKLKACSRKRSFYDPEVKGLRRQLKDSYESLLFLDAAFSAANDVEGQLWRTVFYMPIEEFRARIRKADKEAQQQTAALPANGPDAATILGKTAAAFLKFLDDASLFYKRLVMQLQSAYGDVKVRLELPPGVPLVRTTAAVEGGDGMQTSTGSSIARDMRTSIHRCLVFLGDLARYASQAAPKAAAAAGQAASAGNSAAKGEWMRAISYYRMAAHVLPRSGNPHNQLAVMAFMSGEELKAAYHYARSLCVHVPFMTARENLLQLLQTNRDRYGNLCKQRQIQQEQGGGRPALSIQQQLAELGTCYVRLCGLLYDRINQHEYARVAKDAFDALAGLLDHPQLLLLLQRQKLYDCTPLHLVVLGIFMVHHSFGSIAAGGSGHTRHADQQQQDHQHMGNGSSHSRPSTGEASAAAQLNGAAHDSSNGALKTYVAGPGPLSPIAVAPGDAAQRSVLRGRSLAMLFRTARLLAQAATAAVNAEAAAAVAGGACNGVAAAAAAGKTGATCLLVGLNVALQWLAAQPNCAVLQAATATEEDVKARSKFWNAAGQLLMVLAPALSLYSEQRQQQQQQQQQGSPGTAAAAGADGGPGSGAGLRAGSAGGGISGSLGADASCEEGALPEDLELLGFEPMRSRHYWHVTDVGKHAVDETRTRIKRMLAAARVTAAALAADQQQQAAAHQLVGSISPQALNQLNTAVQLFVEVVATVAAPKTPTASPKVHGFVPGAAGTAAASPAAAPWTAAAVDAKPPSRQQQRSPGTAAEAPGVVTAMDVDGEAVEAAPRQAQQQQQPVLVAAAAATPADASAGRDADECEEEVIVFQPRSSRLSSPSVTAEDVSLPPPATSAAMAAMANPATAAAAAGSGGSHTSGSMQAQQSRAAAASKGAAAAGPPPIPQTLLAGRQAGSSATASPTLRSTVGPPQHLQQQHEQQLGAAAQRLAQHAAAAATGSGSGSGPGSGGTGVAQLAGRGAPGQQQSIPAGSGIGPAAVPASTAGALLQGPAATALDLQQAQAASDLLLARLNARQAAPPTAAAGGGQHGAVAVSAAGPAPGFGRPGAATDMGTGLEPRAPLQHQQQQYQPLMSDSAVGGLPVQHGAAPQVVSTSMDAEQAGLGGVELATAQALLGSGLASLLGGLAEELLAGDGDAVVPDTVAATGVDGSGYPHHAGPLGGGRGGTAAGDQPGAGALAAVSAALAASRALVGDFGMQQLAMPPTVTYPDFAGGSTAMVFDEPLAAMGMLGIPTNRMELSIGVPGSTAAAGQPGMYTPGVGGLAGHGPGPLQPQPDGLHGVQGFAGAEARPLRSISASAATTSAALTAAARKSSEPVSIMQQYAAAAVAGPGADGGAQQQLSSSYVANYHMEATAMDAANRVLSPDMFDSGLELLQQRKHHQQQQQQHVQQQQQQHEQQQQQQQQQRVPSGGALAGGGELSAMHSRGGSWVSGSTTSTPRAVTPRAGGLAAALQQQQLQAHMAQRRLSGGSASPRSAVGAERSHQVATNGVVHAGGAAADAAQVSWPGRLSGAALAAPGAQRQQRSSISAMFAGPDLFLPTEQLPPMHRRVSSGGNSGPLLTQAAGGGAAPAAPAAAAAAAAAAAVVAADMEGANAGRGLAGGGDGCDTAMDDVVLDGQEGGLLPSFLGDILQRPANSGPAAAAAAPEPVPTVLQRQTVQQQQRQQGVRPAAGSPDPADEGLTLVEYLAAQQRKLQQQGTWAGADSSNGLQAAAATGADLSAHVLLPPLDLMESQHPFG